MQGSPTKVFTEKFGQWVRAYNLAKGEDLDADLVLAALLEKLPSHVPARLGMALLDGVLVTTNGCEIGPPGCPAYYVFAKSSVDGQARRCGERYFQLAEYAALHAMAQGHPSLAVTLEDAEMDLTVRNEVRLLGYLEIKVLASEARPLIKNLRSHQGPIPERYSGCEDHIKKANYILSENPPQPIAFAVRAGDNGRVFDESYEVSVAGRELNFLAHDDPFALQIELSLLTDSHLRGQACLVWSLERETGLIIRRGKYQQYLVYREVGDRTLIVVGTERSGSVYTVLDSLGPDERERFEDILQGHGISLGELEGQHRMWKRDGRSLILSDEDEARALGRKIGKLLAASKSV